MSDVTNLLAAIDRGDPHAAAQLMPVVYDELRRLAARKLAGEKPGQTLDATGLVHEAYMRLVGNGETRYFADHSHFYSAAAVAMRRILIDNARRKRSAKRGGKQQRVPLHEIEAPTRTIDDLLLIDEALTALETEDPESAELVKLRYFAGLSIEEASEALGMSRSTAYRTWSFAKAWLRIQLNAHDELQRNPDPP